MYETYNFIEKNGNIETTDGWFCYLNRRGGVRVVPTVKSILSYYKRATIAALLGMLPKWSWY